MRVVIATLFAREISQHAQHPGLAPARSLLLENSHGFVTGCLRALKFSEIDIDGALVGQHPGLSVARAERIEETQALFKIRHGFSIISQSFMDGAAIPQGPGIPFVVGQVAECGKGKLKVSQRIIIVAVTATHLAQHRLHPGHSFRIVGLAKQPESLLGMLTRQGILPLFTE